MKNKLAHIFKIIAICAGAAATLSMMMFVGVGLYMMPTVRLIVLAAIIVASSSSGVISGVCEAFRVKSEPKDKSDEFRYFLMKYKMWTFIESSVHMIFLLGSLSVALIAMSCFGWYAISFVPIYVAIFWFFKDVVIAVRLGKQFWYRGVNESEADSIYFLMVKIFMAVGGLTALAYVL